MPVDYERFAVHAAWIFAVSIAGGLIPLVRRWSHAHLHTLISLSAGIILGVLFFRLLPLTAHTTSHFYTAAIIGFILMLTLEKFVFIHPHEAEELAGQRSGLVAYLGISFHSLLDGLAMGSSALAPHFAPAVLFAILAHKVPDSFSLTSILTFFGYSRRRALWMLVLFSLLTPVGGWISLLALRGMGESQLGWILGLASGTFLFIATSDLLPHAHEHYERRYRNLAAVVAGILLIFLTRGNGAH